MAPGRRRSSPNFWLAALTFSACLVAASTPLFAQDAGGEQPPPVAEGVRDVAEELENSQVGQLIERFTYVAIIGVLFLCGLGLPLPEEVPILTSAILSQTGHLRWWWALSACMFGVMIGDSVMFFLGRRWGNHLLEHRLSRKLLTVERQAAIERYFDRYGARIIFGARFLPGIRAALFLSAGTMKVSFLTFLLMDGAAALLSIPLSFWLAYTFTDKLEELLNLREHVHIWAIGLLAVGMLLWLLLHRFWEKRHPHDATSAGATAAPQAPATSEKSSTRVP
jgi:membrane protein DedA with SNARE-associated domain